jgi:hypothetical protein
VAENRVKVVSSVLRSEITGIDQAVLAGDLQPYCLSVAQLMSWAVHRETTRGEDKAYSLLGLFDVNMPLLYGEGEPAMHT